MDIKETIQKIKKTKPEIKKELQESITNGKKNENTDMQEKVNKYTANEEDESRSRNWRDYSEQKKVISHG